MSCALHSMYVCMHVQKSKDIAVVVVDLVIIVRDSSPRKVHLCAQVWLYVCMWRMAYVVSKSW